MFQELDPKEAVNPGWIETGMSEEVLSYASKMPQDLVNVKDEDVSTGTIYYATIHKSIDNSCQSENTTSKYAWAAPNTCTTEHGCVMLEFHAYSTNYRGTHIDNSLGVNFQIP